MLRIPSLDEKAWDKEAAAAKGIGNSLSFKARQRDSFGG